MYSMKKNGNLFFPAKCSQIRTLNRTLVRLLTLARFDKPKHFTNILLGGFVPCDRATFRVVPCRLVLYAFGL
jgi:hypothetical protein